MRTEAPDLSNRTALGNTGRILAHGPLAVDADSDPQTGYSGLMRLRQRDLAGADRS